ncbi:MAG: hypothetical protein PHH70_05110, partial [Candidatus Gracilibacteria bacterium]|nr:hypothetical protein [Candidatus Gracilibacteria bacterium]
MFIEVIPFGGSIDDGGLTYFARDELAESIRIGCLVEVPFRNALDYAIVTNLVPPLLQKGDTCVKMGSENPGMGMEEKEGRDEAENIRSIVRIITPLPLLSPYQIRTIFACASYYFVHTHHILSLFLPKTIVKYLEKRDFGALTHHLSRSKRDFLKAPEGIYVSESEGEMEKTKETKQYDGNKIHFSHHTSESPFFQAIQQSIYPPSPSVRELGGGLDGRCPRRQSHQGSSGEMEERGAEGGGIVLVFPDDFSIDAYLRSYPHIPETTLVV